MRAQLLTVLATLAASASANVKITSPLAGATLTGGGSITVTFEDDGTTPTFEDLKTFSVVLMAGGSAAGTFGPVVNGPTAQAYAGTGEQQASFVVPAASGKVSTNAYFLQIYSTGADGGNAITYSDRFGMTGMTATAWKDATILAGIPTIQGNTDVPPPVDALSNASPTGATGEDGAAGGVPYRLQTGLIKYAPMQPIPGTKITAKNFTPLNPSSSYSIFKTYAPPASITLTVTATQTASLTSRENTVAAASQPARGGHAGPSQAGPVQKYLKRWAD